MNVAKWICFGLGTIAIVEGMGLIAYGLLQKRTVAGQGEEDVWTARLRALALLSKEIGKRFPNQAVLVGVILFCFGLALIFAPMFIPGFGG